MSYSPQYPAAPSGEQAVYPTLTPQDPGASYDAMLRAGAQAPRRSGVEVAAIVLTAVALLLEGVQLFLRTQGVMRNAGPSLVAYILLEFLVDPLIILLVVGLVQGAVRRVNGALAGVVVLGRDPVASSEHPEASLLVLRGTSLSISKTHALLIPVVDGLWVADLHSTNGTTIIHGGASRRAVPGIPEPVFPGDRVLFGKVGYRVKE